MLKTSSQRAYLLKTPCDKGLPVFTLNTIFKTIIFVTNYASPALCKFLTAQQIGQINSSVQ